MKNGSKRGQSSNFRDSAPNKRPSVAPFEAPNDILRMEMIQLGSYFGVQATYNASSKDD